MAAAVYEDRLRRLEDIEEIRCLHAAYLDYVDKGWDGKEPSPAGLREVLADDVEFSSTKALTEEQRENGTTMYRGVDAVISMLEQATDEFQFVMHSMQNSVIKVDGDSAAGTMLIWVGAKQQDVMNQWYLRAFSKYVRTAGGWRIKEVILNFAATLNELADSHH
ncbi:MAG: nuclear transport factor 2 family protein [Acidimicrobiales bacterium]